MNRQHIKNHNVWLLMISSFNYFRFWGEDGLEATDQGGEGGG